MGLIKAAVGAIGSTLHDQWKEAIRCEDLGNDILMKKVTTDTQVITNKSTIIVGPGQCAIIYDNGRIIDATAEEGFYTFDDSSSPSFFAGQFGAVFKEMWQRFTYNGATAKQQAVFFFNIKEIINNNYGTQAPVPYQDWSHAIPNQMTGQVIPLSVHVRSHGKYTFKIANPSLFMQTLAGTANIYRKEQLIEQIRSEVLDTFQNLLNELGNSKHKIPVLELPSETDEIEQVMEEAVFDEPLRRKGIEITGFTVESLTLDDESKKKIDSYELSSNSYMQQGRLVESYAEAVKGAANNANGAANGFMGIGMMNMASGGVMGGASQGPWQNAPTPQNITPEDIAAQTKVAEPEATTQTPASTVVVESQDKNKEETVEEKQQEESDTNTVETPKTKKFCPECGTKLTEGSKFCPECGTKL